MSKVGTAYNEISKLDATSAAALTDTIGVLKSTGEVEAMTLTQLATLIEGGSFEDLTLEGPTPTLVFKDTDCTDDDDNAVLSANASATGSGVEDIDVTLTAQAAGAATNVFAFTASNDALTLGAASGSLLGFYGETGVNKGTALTAAASAITHTAPGTPDAAVQDLVSTAASFGFVTKDEGNTVLRNIVNMDTRIGELESRLQDVKLIN